MKRLIFYLLSSLCIFPCFAEDKITPQTQREILLKSLEIVDQYEMSMLVADFDSEQNFIDLFETDSMLIYNDLLGISQKREILLKDYITLIQEKVKNPIFILKNVRRGDIVDNGDNYELTVYFDKSLNYSNACGVLLSSEDYFKKDHELAMQIVFDKDNLQGKVHSLTGSIDSKKPWLGDDIVILNYTSKYDHKVKCNGKPVKFNSFEQAILPKNPTFTFSDPDMRLKVFQEGKNCQTYSLKYIPKRWSVRPYFEMAIGEPYQMESDINNIDFTSSMMDFGAEIMYTFPNDRRVKWSLITGVGYNMSTMDIKFNGDLDYMYHAPKSADLDGDEYDRYYKVGNVTQKAELAHVSVPLALGMDVRLGSAFSLYAQLGVKSYIKMKAETTENSGSQDVYGIYYQYGEPIIFDDPGLWGYNNFGQSSWGTGSLKNPELNANTFTADPFFGLGFRLRLFGGLSLTAAAKYQLGIMKVIETEGDVLELYNEGSTSTLTEENALVTYDVAKGEQVRNLTDVTKSIKRGGLFVNVGLSIKF